MKGMQHGVPCLNRLFGICLHAQNSFSFDFISLIYMLRELHTHLLSTSRQSLLINSSKLSFRAYINRKQDDSAE